MDIELAVRNRLNNGFVDPVFNLLRTANSTSMASETSTKRETLCGFRYGRFKNQIEMEVVFIFTNSAQPCILRRVRQNRMTHFDTLERIGDPPVYLQFNLINTFCSL